MFEKEPYYTEKIEAYLRNQLTEGEKAEFEQTLQQDPLLYNEFKLQQEVVTSIQSYRKSQLKQRLQNIDVTDIVSGGSGYSALTSYIIAGAAALGLAGWLTFNYFQSDLPAKHENTSVVIRQQVAAPSADPLAETGDSRAIRTRESIEGSNNAGNTVSSDFKKEAPAKAAKVAKQSSSTGMNRATLNANAQAEEKPHTEETPRKAGSEHTFKSTNTIGDAGSAGQLHVMDNTNSRLKQHYYYHNNQVALLGFDLPYVLLEIQPVNSVYLYYDGQFYQLDTSRNKPSPISENLVKDPELIQRLNERLNQRD